MLYGGFTMSYICKSEYDKNEAILSVKEYAKKWNYKILEEKEINNNLGYKLKFEDFSMIIYFKNNKTSKVVYEKSSKEQIEAFSEIIVSSDTIQNNSNGTIPIHTILKLTEDKRYSG